jgi:hypothetical protein
MCDVIIIPLGFGRLRTPPTRPSAAVAGKAAVRAPICPGARQR